VSRVDLDAIEARAKVATPGPWVPLPSGSRKWVTAAGADAETWQVNRDADAAHVAGMDPATTLELVAELRALYAAVEGANQHLRRLPWTPDGCDLSDVTLWDDRQAWDARQAIEGAAAALNPWVDEGDRKGGDGP
jgi:hypothetical protein